MCQSGRSGKFTWVVGAVPLPLLLLQPETVVVPGVPVRVHLEVLLPLHPGLFVILGLLVPAQAMPLCAENDQTSAWVSDRISDATGFFNNFSPGPLK